MCDRRSAQTFKVVTALKRGHNLAAATTTRDLENGAGCPGKILGFQRLMCQWIPPVSVESGGDQDQVRREIIQGRHQATGKGRAPGFSGCMGCDRGVHDIADARLGGRACARIKRHLVNRAQEQAGIMLERGLGPVAMMNIKINDGDAGHAKRLTHTRSHRHRGKQTETHGPVRLGVVARWSHGGEGTAGPAIGHGPDRIDDRARRQTRGPDTARRQQGVGIQLHRSRRR